MTRQVNLSLLLLLCLATAVLLVACTTGRLRGSSSGWSPAAAVPLPKDTGDRLSEGKNLDALDNSLTVTNSAAFVEGQILQIDDEQLQVISIKDRDLIVERGVNNTRPQPHADQTPIFSLGEKAVVFVSTKQGEFIALVADGTKDPAISWTYHPPERER